MLLRIKQTGYKNRVFFLNKQQGFGRLILERLKINLLIYFLYPFSTLFSRFYTRFIPLIPKHSTPFLPFIFMYIQLISTLLHPLSVAPLHATGERMKGKKPPLTPPKEGNPFGVIPLPGGRGGEFEGERVRASPNPSEGGGTPSLSGRAGEGLSNLQIKN
jgi:hypothetical protein